MAKSQKRSSREPKKPKSDKKKEATPASVFTTPLAKKKPTAGKSEAGA